MSATAKDLHTQISLSTLCSLWLIFWFFIDHVHRNDAAHPMALDHDLHLLA
jgi:hypothetical protein